MTRLHPCRKYRRGPVLLALSLIALLNLTPGAGFAEEPTNGALLPKAITPAIMAFYRQIVCMKCNGDGIITKNVQRRVKKDGTWWRINSVEEEDCPSCGGDGLVNGIDMVAHRERLKATAERFVATLATIDLNHENAPARLEAVRVKLERMQCVLDTTKNQFFNEWTLQLLNRPGIENGAAVIITGTYRIESDPDDPNTSVRRVSAPGSNMALEFHNILIHDATDRQSVLAGGVFQGFRIDEAGVKVAMIADGFIVRTDPDCGG